MQELKLRTSRIYGKCTVDGCDTKPEEKNEFWQIQVDEKIRHLALCEVHAGLSHYPAKVIFK